MAQGESTCGLVESRKAGGASSLLVARHPAVRETFLPHVDMCLSGVTISQKSSWKSLTGGSGFVAATFLSSGSWGPDVATSGASGELEMIAGRWRQMASDKVARRQMEGWRH